MFSKLSRKWFLLPVLGLVAVACGKNLAMLFFNLPVDQRATESLALDPPATAEVANVESFKFAVFGDMQIRDENKSMLSHFKKDVASKGIDFFLVLGDITEDANLKQIENAKTGLDAVGVPYYVTLGNHDLFQASSQGGWEEFKKVFGPATYSVTVADKIRFLMIDTAAGNIGKVQFDWLEEELETRPVEFTVIGSHYPIYDGITPLIWRLESLEERLKITQLINRAGVDYFVAAHIHAYTHNTAGNVPHIIVGSMYPYELDYGNRGYVLFTYEDGKLSWKRVELDGEPEVFETDSE